jgi:hypothetical protein
MVSKTDASDEGDETSSESESSGTWDTKPRKDKVKNTDPKKMNPSLSQPSRTEVTLSGLLNTLDGPGSREGHIVILTTNAPDSLDKALYRPGRIDTQVYLGFADQVTAGIIFTRIFGSDKQVKESQKAVRKLGREFERLVPSDFFTPAEIQKFCMNRRGQPQKAVDEFPGYIDEKRTRKTKFQYDIHRRAPKPTFHREEVMHDDNSSDEVEYTPRDSGESFEGAHTTFLELSCISSTETSVKRPAKEQLFVAHGHEHDDDALAYGDYYPRRQWVWEDRLADDVVDTCQGLRDMLTFPSVMPFRHQSTPCKECSLQDWQFLHRAWGKASICPCLVLIARRIVSSLEYFVSLTFDHGGCRASTTIYDQMISKRCTCRISTLVRPYGRRFLDPAQVRHLSMSLGQHCRLRQNPQNHLHTTRLCLLANRSSRLFSATAGPVTQTSLAAAMSILITGLYHAPLKKILG